MQGIVFHHVLFCWVLNLEVTLTAQTLEYGLHLSSRDRIPESAESFETTWYQHHLGSVGNVYSTILNHLE